MSVSLPTQAPKRCRVLKTGITRAPYADCLAQIMTLAASRQSSYVCLANVHMVVEAYRDPGFNEVLKKAHMVTPDGKPLCLAIKWLYGCQQERVAGMDLMPDILFEAERRNLGVFF